MKTQIIIDKQIRMTDPPPDLVTELQRRLTFLNPAFIEAHRQNRWTGNIERQLCFLREGPDGLTLPRGYARQLIGVCHRLDVKYQIVDNRRTLPEVDFTFTGTLKPFQSNAAKNTLARDFGTLSAPTGSGKTVMALAIIAKRRQPALVVVHTKELLNQWIDRASRFLDLNPEKIGVIGGGKKQIGDRLTIGIVNSVYRCADQVASHIGHLVVDECHRAPSRTFTEAVKAFDCNYMLGLSATPYRRDGLSRLIYWYLGDVVHEVERIGLIEDGHILEADIVTRKTNFQTRLDASAEYQTVLSELTIDPERNRLIASDVAKEAGNGSGACLVLTDRKRHVGAIYKALERQNVKAAILTGDTSKSERERIVDALNSGKEKVLIATGQLIGEGFDCRNLSTLFLATPVKFSGRVLQYLGRVLRPAPGKDKARVFDYQDIKVGVLKASAKARERVYRGQHAS